MQTKLFFYNSNKVPVRFIFFENNKSFTCFQHGLSALCHIKPSLMNYAITLIGLTIAKLLHDLHTMLCHGVQTDIEIIRQRYLGVQFSVNR